MPRLMHQMMMASRARLGHNSGKSQKPLRLDQAAREPKREQDGVVATGHALALKDVVYKGGVDARPLRELRAVEAAVGQEFTQIVDQIAAERIALIEVRLERLRGKQPLEQVLGQALLWQRHGPLGRRHLRCGLVYGKSTQAFNESRGERRVRLRRCRGANPPR